MINKIITKAKSQIGIKENPANSNKVKYNTAYYGRVVSGSAYPWCVVFIWWLFKECGASKYFYGGGKTASSTTLMSYYKKKGQLSNTPKVGAIAFFQFDKDSNPDHVGLVIEVKSNGSVVTIEGNTSVGNDSNGGEVMQRTRSKSLILGYAYPFEIKSVNNPTSGSGDTVNVTLTILKSGSKGDSVRALQILLNGFGYSCGTADGEFGAKTLRAVKQFQTKNKLTADGVVGSNTWNALLT